VKNKLHTISIGQTTHQDSVKKSGLRRILFHKSCLPAYFVSLNKSGMQRIFYISIKKFFLIFRECIWFQVAYSVYPFIFDENGSNFNTECNMFQTVFKKGSNNKPFVKSNFLRYKSHNNN